MDSGTLAHWTYSGDEWRKYVHEQWEQGIRGMIRSVILFFLLAAGAVVLTGKWLPFFIILVLTEWIPILEYRSAMHSRDALAQAPADSLVREDGLEYTHFVLGPRRVSLEGRKVVKVGVVRKKSGLTYLLVAHKGARRRSSVIPDMVPVPQGREAEAAEAAERLKQVWMAAKTRTPHAM